MRPAGAKAAVGLGGLQPLLDPKTPWSPLLAPLHFGEEKMRKKERKKRGKKKSAHLLRISGFATGIKFNTWNQTIAKYGS